MPAPRRSCSKLSTWEVGEPLQRDNKSVMQAESEKLGVDRNDPKAGGQAG